MKANLEDRYSWLVESLSDDELDQIAEEAIIAAAKEYYDGDMDAFKNEADWQLVAEEQIYNVVYDSHYHIISNLADLGLGECMSDMREEVEELMRDRI